LFAAGWTATGAGLLATRVPDLDLRLAPEGLRVAAGVGLVDRDVLPTLVQRLALDRQAPPVPEISSARRLYFETRGPGWALRGRIAIAGLDGLRLRLLLRVEPEALYRARREGRAAALGLWTRERLVRRAALQPAEAAVDCILPLGHYFVGPSMRAAPWFAFAVEADLLTPRELEACAYDLCRRGLFHSALGCLERAAALAPEAGTAAAMLAELRAFAGRFGLADRDRDIRFAPRRAQRSDADGPPPLELPLASESAVERVIALVQALRRRTEAHEPVGADPGATARFLSRRGFRSAYALLLARLQACLAPHSARGFAGSLDRAGQLLVKAVG
jgi:hypothetical protein